MKHFFLCFSFLVLSILFSCNLDYPLENQSFLNSDGLTKLAPTTPISNPTSPTKEDTPSINDPTYFPPREVSVYPKTFRNTYVSRSITFDTNLYTQEHLKNWDSVIDDYFYAIYNQEKKVKISSLNIFEISLRDSLRNIDYERKYLKVFYTDLLREYPALFHTQKYDTERYHDLIVKSNDIPIIGQRLSYLNDDKQQYHKTLKEMFSWINYYVNAVDSSMNETQAVTAIYDRYIRAKEYGGSTTAGSNVLDTVFTKQIGVCQDYTTNLAFLFKLVGIESVTPSTSNYRHIWNCTKVAGNWYFMDGTWDGRNINFSKRPKHKYFLKQAIDFTKNDDIHNQYVSEAEFQPMIDRYGIDLKASVAKNKTLIHYIDTVLKQETTIHFYNDYWYWVNSDDKTVCRSKWTDDYDTDKPTIETIGILDGKVSDDIPYTMIYNFLHDTIVFYDFSTHKVKTQKLGSILEKSSIIYENTSGNLPKAIFLLDDELIIKYDLDNIIHIQSNQTFNAAEKNCSPWTFARLLNMSKLLYQWTDASLEKGELEKAIIKAESKYNIDQTDQNAYSELKNIYNNFIKNL